MSSTKRGGQRSPADDYPTPNWCTHRFLDRFLLRHPEAVEGRWLEPGAGEGNILRGIGEWFSGVGKYVLPVLDACELREECLVPLQRYADTVQIGDYFELGPSKDKQYSVILTNPPFSLAMEFILRSLQSETSRFTVMLLRLNYVGSQNRHAFFSTCAPDLYILPNRPSFRGTGEVDSIEYAWFVWDKKNLYRPRGYHEMLDLTPLDIRKAEHDYLTESGLFPLLASGRKKKKAKVTETGENK